MCLVLSAVCIHFREIPRENDDIAYKLMKENKHKQFKTQTKY